MPPTDALRLHPEILPQVGANLYLDTALDPCHVERGNRHWLLSGSCVLVAPDRILTIGHALARKGHHAAFFPFEGIVRLKGAPIRQFPYGDSVVLATLDRALSTVAPLPYWKIWKSSLQGAEALVGGFGDWKGIPGAERDGLQRLARVQLGRLPERHEGRELREDNLDISWWTPHNDGLEALLDNSGGPLLRAGFRGSESSFGIVGITRERLGPQQVCSWITGDRDLWLRRWIGWPRWRRPREEPREKHVRNLVIDAGGHVERLPVPPGATRVKVTLSATGGMRLQMGIRPVPVAGSFLDDLAADNGASGRFLFREADLNGNTDVEIGVAPVARAPARAESVSAQLCCMFL